MIITLCHMQLYLDKISFTLVYGQQLESFILNNIISIHQPKPVLLQTDKTIDLYDTMLSKNNDFAR